MTATAPPTANLYDVLTERGLVAQCTESDDAIRRRLGEPATRPVTAYCGFDPTADSLHLGHLVPVMALAHLQRAGHRPLAVVGGATGMVGDPSGKSEARNMLDEATLRHNVECVGRQLGQFLSFGQGPTDALLLNNYDWIRPLSWLEVLRDIGSKMSVNRMLSMESVKQRVSRDIPVISAGGNISAGGSIKAGGTIKAGGSISAGADINANTGISYLEFSYMLLQAYDFTYLHREHSCTLQVGGQDQWGNIVMGIELGRKMDDAELAGLTCPLVTKSDGGKFGKTESGAVWLDAERTPVFEFFQFWRNVADADVGKYLGYFTFLPMDEVRALSSAQGKDINAAKVRLAFEVTKLVHGEAEATKARDAAGGAFSAAGPDVTGESIPSAELSADELAAGPGVLDLLVRAGLAKSKGEARRLVQGGGVRVHDAKVADVGHTLGPDDAVDGYVLLRAGKKRLFRFDVV
ncbi:MAG: tyrosine--tRNA ligase [Planctomycetota bacterium]